MAKADGVVTTDENTGLPRIVRRSSQEERNVTRLFNLAQEDIAGFEVYAKKLADCSPMTARPSSTFSMGFFTLPKLTASSTKAK